MGWEVFSKNDQFEVGVGDKSEILDRQVVWRSSSPFGFSNLVQFCCKQRGFHRIIFDMSRSRG